MLITEITMDPTKVQPGHPLFLRVGEPAVDGGHIVEKITWNPANALFNKGKEVGEAGYVVFFSDISERRFVKDWMVTSVELAKEETKKETTIPDLPV